MFGWIKESAVYEAGLIGSSSWDEESSSYKVQLPEEVLQEAARVMDKGYLFLIHATIEVDGGASEVYLQGVKLETQDGQVQEIRFADGSTLAGVLLTIHSGEGGSDISNIWATPQMYGALGDGVHDDSEAIAECLHSNKAVFIPRGYYKVTKTIQTYCRDITTVICDKKAIFIADENFSDPYMFIFSQYVGYSAIGVSWTGGIFCCNGIEGLTGILINNYCQFGYFNNITVIDVGNNGTGIEVASTSGKNVLDSINIFGTTFNIDVTNPTGNISIKNYDLTRNNVGLKNTDSYDYSIGTLYVMACQVGILSSGGQQVNCGQYHYWIGSDSSAHSMTWENYIKTRGFKSTTNYDNWHFDMFYPDKPFIAFEGAYISADNVHYIAPKKEIISNPPTDMYCYLFLLTNADGNIKFNNVDINVSNDRMEYRGGLTPNNALDPYRKKAIKIEYSYQDVFDYLTPANCINNSNRAIDQTIGTNGDYIIGYVCTSSTGSAHFRITTPGNSVALDFDVISKTYNALLFNVTNYDASQAFKVVVSLGQAITVNGYLWQPVIISHGAQTLQNVMIEVTGILPFQPVVSALFTGTIADHVTAYGNSDIYTLSIPLETASIEFTPGINVVNIAKPIIPNGYVIIPFNFGYKCSGSSGNKLIVSDYDMTNNKITVFNPTNDNITSIVNIRQLCTRSHI